MLTPIPLQARPRLISISEAAEILGVSTGTLRRWDREDKLMPVARTEGNHRRYALSDILVKAGKASAQQAQTVGLTLCYARVSSHVWGSTLGSILLANDLWKIKNDALKTQLSIFLAGLACWMCRRQQEVITYLQAEN